MPLTFVRTNAYVDLREKMSRLTMEFEMSTSLVLQKLVESILDRCGLVVALSLIFSASVSLGTPAIGEPPPPPTEVPDNSLTTEEYAKLGVPALDKEWTTEDCSKAISILATLAKEDISKLPRSQSKKSGALLEKLCKHVSFDALSNFRSLYANEKWQFDNENVEISLALSRLLSERRREQQKRLDQLPIDSEERAELEADLKGMVYMQCMNLAQSDLLRTHSHWRAAARTRYYAGLGDALPEMIEQLPLSGRIGEEAIYSSLLLHRAIDPDAQVKAAIKKLLRTFSASVRLATLPWGSPKPKKIADNSLTKEEYAKLGIPSLDKKWTAENCSKAIAVLSALDKQDITKLPRSQSKTSGALFEKLCRHATLTTLGDLLNIYDNENGQYDNEDVEIRLAYFRLSLERQRQLQKRIETLPEDSKERVDLQVSLDRCVLNDFMALAVPISYAKHIHWRPEAKVRYYSGLADVLPEIFKRLPAKVSNTTIDEKMLPLFLSRCFKDETDPQVKAAIKKLLSEFPEQTSDAPRK